MSISKPFTIVLLIFLCCNIFAQTDVPEARYIRIGELQSLFSSYGAERAWNNVYYEGLSWPSQYSWQDNAVIERYWIACRDFTDAGGVNYPYYGIYVTKSYVGLHLFPVELKQIARNRLPDVYINGIKQMTDEEEQVDEYDPNLPADRMVVNVVNTSMGLTMTRKIYAFSHPNHDDYFIKEYIFENTGNTDYDAEIERTETLKAVRIGKLPRYSVCREGASKGDRQQAWGKHSWVSRRGENYADHASETINDDYTIADWIRCGFSWAGQSEYFTYDLIGAPILNDNTDERLSAPQFAGIAVLHVDKSSADSGDDPGQPAILGWHAGDTYPQIGDLEPSDSLHMHKIWDLLGGMAYPDAQYGGADRMDESNLSAITDRVDPYKVHGDGGGTGIWIGYGPFDLAHGESITIVEVDGVNGLSREKCQEIGKNWLQAYQNQDQEYSFELPDGSVVNGRYSDGAGNAADVYKNTWFYTGIDSILLTFSRAKRNYDSGFAVADAPRPPGLFEVFSDTVGIRLKWDSSAELYPDFAGYRVYRKTERAENIFELVFECGEGTENPTLVHEFTDQTVENDVDYLYCITAFDNGNANNGRRIESNIHATLRDQWVRTGEPVIIQNIYVSPDGDDNNDGLTSETPFRTIHHALEKIQPTELYPLTIFLAEGKYSPSMTGELFPLELKSNLTIQGAGKIKTIIDAENQDLAFNSNSLDNIVLSGFSIIRGDGILGGGIYAEFSSINLIDIRVTNCHSNNFGGGIYNICSRIVYDPNQRCDVFDNYADNWGSDIYRSNYIDTSIVYLDTITVETVSPYEIYPPIIPVDFLHTSKSQVNADLYISPSGNDSNTGLSSDNPLKTFRAAISGIYADDQNPHTIFLDSGVYSTSDTHYSHIVCCRDNVSVKGAGRNNTILDSISVKCFFTNNITISDMTIRNASYTGVNGLNSDVLLSNIGVENNSSFGIYSRGSTLEIDSCIINDNAAGISLSDTHLKLKQSTIRRNSGIGIYASNSSTVEFDSLARNNIYLNGIGHDLGGDLFFVTEGPHDVYLDTFTYLYPIPKSVYPIDRFIFDIRAAKLPQILGNAYVSPNGSDSNTGVSWESPLKTIKKAMETLYTYDNRPHTIFLGEGIFSASSNGESMPITPNDNVMLKGRGDSLTILDGEDEFKVIECYNKHSVFLNDLSIIRGAEHSGAGVYSYRSSLFFDNVSIQSCNADYGAGIYCDNSTINMDTVLIRECKGSNGAGLYLINNSKAVMNFVAITDDSAKYGSAIRCRGSNLRISNSTIVNNGDYIGGIHLDSWTDINGNTFECEIFIVNSIFWENGKYQIAAYPSEPVITIAHSNIYEGIDKIRYSFGVLNWLDGNMDADPLFVGGDPFDYHLTADSPCRETGTNLVVFEGDTLFYLPDSCYSGTAPNIGCWGVNPALSLNPDERLPEKFVLYPNYPNPFNPSTTIAYDLPVAGKVKIVIYDILGREVRSLLDEFQAAGHYTLCWDGRNNRDNLVAAGIYIVRCAAGEKYRDQKMLLLK